MKGIVFCEFVEMMEQEFSADMADEIISGAELESGGAYTTVGTYDHREMLVLVTRLSEKTGAPVPELVKAFGRYLFGRFVELYPAFFDGIDGAFSFLDRIEEHVHVEVKKLYPDAELPTFDTSRPDKDTMIMVYQSRRPFADLALGLIEGCIAHYTEPVDVQMEDLSNEGRTHVRFTLTRQQAVGN
jgi:hypothetical protein